MSKPKPIFIGTSGWHYDHWTGPFYRSSTPQGEWLAYYSERFRTVEINNSFYRLPEKETLRTWRDTVPRNFVFSVKGSRYITHMKKLKDAGEGLRKFLDPVGELGEGLGPVLFQLPGNWHFNGERLRAFLDALPKDMRFAFEFRDPSWHNKAAYEALRARNAAFCVYEFDGFLSPRVITADFAYVRLHGPGAAYRGSYDKKALSGWAGTFSIWSRRGRTVYCFFDNDEKGYAARNALALQELLGH
jgi:uncharacterized protein YecE (DUF72 family)